MKHPAPFKSDYTSVFGFPRPSTYPGSIQAHFCSSRGFGLWQCIGASSFARLPPSLPSLHPLLHGKLTTCHRNHDPSLPLRYDAIQHPGYPIPSHAARHYFEASRYPGLQQPRLETWRQIPMGQSQIAHSHPRYAHHGSSADYVSRWPNLSLVAAVLLYTSMRHLASRLPHYAIPCSTSTRIALTTASNPLVFMSPYLSYTATYRYGYH
ncbi:hypothetical protein BDP55DRAFT_625811 [Colletotrichum godetiae]|uniref:Uncharacterized protein n=1 Tax=Colletotrichum godetiae TaxID=1209918 RepID=A0AAJ0B0J1_9PEZI|nr:uncharacterized protein BDP55DRAFT_625811 [Colletotrichum godetiae]KAK1700208.1 hypothetical protein BDP55DRAFT_625811 [Colletotrichum godetiae]